MKRELLRFLHAIGQEAGRKRSENVLKLIERNTKAYYLDCGSATGELTKKIAKAIGTEKIFGVDRDSTYIRLAQKRGIDVKQGDLNQTIPFKDNFFDVVTAIEVIEHLYDTDTFLRELYRVLKKDGYVVIGTENLASWHNIFALALGLQPSTGPHVSSQFPVGFRPLHAVHTEGVSKEKTLLVDKHINVVTRKTLIHLVQDHGFIVESEKPSGFYPFGGFFSDMMAAIDRNHALTILAKMRKK